MENKSLLQSDIKSILGSQLAILEALIGNDSLILNIEKSTKACIRCFQNGGKVLLCGNGGSAADAQHLAAEFSGKFYLDREPLFAEALHVNSSFLTAAANDYSYEEVYARMLKAKGREGDILIGLSTSGNSENVVRAIRVAKELGMTTIGMTGKGPNKVADIADLPIMIPSRDTPRVQECHMTIGHIICEIVEKTLFDVGS